MAIQLSIISIIISRACHKFLKNAMQYPKWQDVSVNPLINAHNLYGTYRSISSWKTQERQTLKTKQKLTQKHTTTPPNLDPTLSSMYEIKAHDK